MTALSRVKSAVSPAMHPEFAPVAFIAAFLLAIPLIWHWKSGNIGILSIIGWLFVTDMIYAVDAERMSHHLDAIEDYKKCISWCRTHILRHNS
ncbi:STE3-like pheromone receptor [Laccaria bicolor S238N-H82]|uniref:STE3-like pheromone receptor n=1 Tax=Laccaria bicolor (strain S238N-H82 / ATCC MYA-4686) TaxID=486041 RepID=B0DRG7_LACBS|nr:STE3-like pheromone receptor [Laccaria bicolor S238N-H82]EDR02869.1 STE3-like pheromone receptor [Laccaria bicolor S238N-H82]|eukprot:XP_001886579.1 STE3-like pheromone receptor [Laccaria bicolor S238N-H82]